MIQNIEIKNNFNLKQVCSYLGGQLENYCIEFLAEYTDDIIDMLVIWRMVMLYNLEEVTM